MTGRTTIRNLEEIREVRRGRIGRAADGSEVKLLDRPVRRPSSIRWFEELVRRKDEFEQRLNLADPRIKTCWPTKAIRSVEGGIDAYYQMPLQHEFWLTNAGTRIPRNLNLAVDLRGDVGAQEISPIQAREVVALIGRWLQVMHESGLVHGEVAFHSIAYAVDTSAAICILDLEATRKMGTTSLRGPDRSEKDWSDPQAATEEASQDSDRYQFALLAFRLLVTRTRNGFIDTGAVPETLEGFTPHATDLLRGLWERARGPRGSRPNMHEWAYALGAGDMASHPGPAPNAFR